MLYLNNEILDVNNTDSSYKFASVVKEFKTKIANYKAKYGSIVHILSNRRPYVDEKTKILVTVPPKGISLQAITVNNGSRQEWVYSEAPLSMVNNKLDIKEPNLIVKQNGELYLDFEKDSELIFFLLDKSNQVAEEGAGKDFHVNDAKAKEKGLALNRRKIAKLGDVIYDQLSEAEVRVLAKRYGIADTNDITGEAVRNKLYDYIMKNEELRKEDSTLTGIDDFIKETGSDMKNQVGSFIQECIDESFLVYDEKNRVWNVEFLDDKQPLEIMRISLNESSRPQAALLDYLMVDQDSLERLRSARGGKVESVIDITEDIINNTKHPFALRKLAREHFSFEPPKYLTAADLRAELVRRLTALKG